MKPSSLRASVRHPSVVRTISQSVPPEPYSLRPPKGRSRLSPQVSWSRRWTPRSPPQTRVGLRDAAFVAHAVGLAFPQRREGPNFRPLREGRAGVEMDGSRGDGSSVDGKDHRRAHQIPAGEEADEEKAGEDAGDEACDEAERVHAQKRSTPRQDSARQAPPAGVRKGVTQSSRRGGYGYPFSFSLTFGVSTPWASLTAARKRRTNSSLSC